MNILKFIFGIKGAYAHGIKSGIKSAFRIVMYYSSSIGYPTQMNSCPTLQIFHFSLCNSTP
jgi:hypothetical protein